MHGAFGYVKNSVKLAFIVVLTGVAVLTAVGVAVGITKSASFYRFSSLRMNSTAELSSTLTDLRRGDRFDRSLLLAQLTNIRGQSSQCVLSISRLDQFILRRFGTINVLGVCRDDIRLADSAINSLGDFESGKLSQRELMTRLEDAEAQFKQHSKELEAPVDKTIALISTVLIPLIVVISLVNIGFMIYFSRSTTHSVRHVTKLLRHSSNDDELDDTVEKHVSGDLAELLRAAQERTRSDLLNRELSSELEYEVKKRTASLHLANQELAEFAYRTSHDLKAPLSTSKQLARFIKDDIDANNFVEARWNIGKVIDRMERLEQLVVDIASLTRAGIDAGEQEAIDVKQLYDEIVANSVKNELSEPISIIENIETREPLVAERERVSSILENLLSNAIQYKDPKKNAPFVKLKADEEDDRFVLTIEDNGLGIPSSRHSEVFKMFKRFHPKMGSGSGLGLSIVKKHVDHLRGTIDFASSRRGTIFTIQLPKQEYRT